jgi:soluble lytic murein transglycosylase
VLLVACSGARTPNESAGERSGSAAEQRARSAAEWREALESAEWSLVAERIDALPAVERLEPLTRYARALAATRLGDCLVVLSMLDGLAQQVPLLAEDLARMTAECQLAIGPFPAAAAYYEKRGTPEAQLDAALAWRRAAEPERSRELVERVLSRPRLSQSLRVRGRTLRAELAAELGQTNLAIDEYRWLAIEAALPAADVAYERLAQKRMTKGQRLRRAHVFARRGDLTNVLTELDRVKSAPGKSPEAALVLRTEALGQYRSRLDDGRAAWLFERAAQRSGNLDDLFAAARAWSRAGEVARARRLYERVARRHRDGSNGERASFALSRLLFAHGHWSDAERAYTSYLRRYARQRRARHVAEATFERALARLATGRFQAAREGFGSVSLERSRRYPRSLLRHLEAVALISSADDELRARGVALFQSVVREAPLSFAALASSARLRAMGLRAPRVLGALPKVVEPDERDLGLPANVQLLADMGLHGAAERALRSQERALRRRHEPHGAEALCRSYAALGAGARRLAIGASLGKRLVRLTPDTDNLWAWQCLYPQPYARVVQELEALHALPPGLVHAVMRQESGFHPNARSAAGATGLMQLMPATAARVAAELEIVHEPERLTQVRYNLELGTFYLGKLLAAFDQRPALALAAYNAGPHAVARWLRAGGRGLPTDLWVARIPFRETRNYVMRVLTNFARYRHLTGRDIPALSLEPPVAIELAADAY